MNTDRSMNHDLREGATDGKYLKGRPNWGGSTFDDGKNLQDKSTLSYDIYGPTTDAPSQSLPDGTRK